MGNAPAVLLPSRDEVKAERCRRSLSYFIREAWPLVEPGVEYVENWHIGAVCELLEAVSSGDIKQAIINIPPRAMKSLTVAVFWQAWEWLSRPESGWLSLSYGQSLSLRDATKTRRLVQTGGLVGANPDDSLLRRLGYQGLERLLGSSWELTGDVNAKGRFENTESGYRIATSFGGIATGEGGDRIVIDDPHSAKSAKSDVERTAAIEWYDDTIPTRLNDPKTSAVVVVMQRLHEEDLTGHLLEEGGWEHLCLPAEYEVAPKNYTVFEGDPRTEEGQVLDEERLPRERLDQLLKQLGSTAYAGQMQQRPAPKEGNAFKRHWWKRYPEIPALEQVIASWDMRFSDSKKETSSFVVGQLWGVAGAARFLVGQVRARLSFTESLTAVIALNDMGYHVDAKLVEKKANGDAVVDTLKARVPGLIALEPEGGKEARAAAAEPLVEAGDLWLPDGEYIPAPSGYEPTTVEEFIDEHASFPNGAHDDQVDGMSQAMTWLANKPPPPKSRSSHPWA